MAYSSAAAALLISGQEAGAAIIYQDFPDRALDSNSAPFGLDLNGDGNIDFAFLPRSIAGFWSLNAGIGNGAVRSQLPPNCLPPLVTYMGATGCTAGYMVLAAGAPIDVGQYFRPLDATNVDLIRPGKGFLGLRFRIGENSHFGWARIDNSTGQSLTIYDAAFESQPGLGIAAGAVPEPTSLGALALGAAGVMLLRRRQL